MGEIKQVGILVTAKCNNAFCWFNVVRKCITQRQDGIWENSSLDCGNTK